MLILSYTCVFRTRTSINQLHKLMCTHSRTQRKTKKWMKTTTYLTVPDSVVNIVPIYEEQDAVHQALTTRKGFKALGLRLFAYQGWAHPKDFRTSDLVLCIGTKAMSLVSCSFACSKTRPVTKEHVRRVMLLRDGDEQYKKVQICNRTIETSQLIKLRNE